MTVYAYYSDDTDAPTLSGTAGTLLDVLRACLIDGYGSKSPVGWSEEFTGTNVAVFRPLLGYRHYLRVQDDAAFSATYTAMKAGWIAYETMTDIDTGTNAYGLALYTQGSPITKSDELSTTTRPWKLFADEYCFHLFTYPDADVPTLAAGYFFGDLVAFGDHPYAATTYGDITDLDPAANLPGVYNRYGRLSYISNSSTNSRVARTWKLYDGSSVNPYAHLTSDFARGLINTSTDIDDYLNNGLGYRRYSLGVPNSQGVGVIARPVYVVEIPTEATTRIVGAVPGLYDQLTASPGTDILLTNVTGMTDRVFMIVGISSYINTSTWVTNSSSNVGVGQGYAMIDITGPWR